MKPLLLILVFSVIPFAQSKPGSVATVDQVKLSECLQNDQKHIEQMLANYSAAIAYMDTAMMYHALRDSLKAVKAKK